MKKHAAMMLFAVFTMLTENSLAMAPEEQGKQFHPNSEIQSWFKRFNSDNPNERTSVLSAAELDACQTEADFETLLRGKIAQLAEQAGGPERFAGELLYIGSRATDVAEGMLPFLVVSRWWDIAPDAIADALKPYLASEDKRMAAEAAELLEVVEWWKREYGDRFKRMFETPED